MPKPPRLFAVKAPKRIRGRVRRGFDETLAALRASGDLDRRHLALVALCRVLADQVDAAALDPEESRFTVARVASTYHASIAHLLGEATGAQASAVAALLAELLEDDGDAALEEGDGQLEGAG